MYLTDWIYVIKKLNALVEYYFSSQLINQTLVIIFLNMFWIWQTNYIIPTCTYLWHCFQSINPLPTDASGNHIAPLKGYNIRILENKKVDVELSDSGLKHQGEQLQHSHRPIIEDVDYSEEETAPVKNPKVILNINQDRTIFFCQVSRNIWMKVKNGTISPWLLINFNKMYIN